jgi:hypothetical protein
MPFIFDNLTATVIAMTVILILSSIQMRSTRQQVAQTSSQIVQDRSRQITEWVEEDLNRIGQNMTQSEVAFEDPKENKKWLTERFVFDRKVIQTDGSIDRIKTRYQVNSTGNTREIYVDGETKAVELYELVRQTKVVGGSGGWTDKGGVSALEYFDVDLLDQNAEPVLDPVANEASIRSVRIRFSVLAPFQNSEMSFPASRTNVVVGRYPLGDS